MSSEKLSPPGTVGARGAKSEDTRRFSLDVDLTSREVSSGPPPDIDSSKNNPAIISRGRPKETAPLNFSSITVLNIKLRNRPTKWASRDKRLYQFTNQADRTGTGDCALQHAQSRR